MYWVADGQDGFKKIGANFFKFTTLCLGKLAKTLMVDTLLCNFTC